MPIGVGGTMKRYWAIWTRRTILTVVIVFGLGLITESLINPGPYSEPVQAGFIAVAIYLFAIVALSILHAIVGAIYLWWFADRDFTESVLDDLRASKLPAPEPYDSKTFDYLAELADDESQPVAVRVRSAVLFGQYKQAMIGGLFKSLAIRRGIDSAVLRYASEGPQRRESQEAPDYTPIARS